MIFPLIIFFLLGVLFKKKLYICNTKEVRLEVLATKLYVFKLKHNKRIIASGPFFYAQNVKVLSISLFL